MPRLALMGLSYVGLITAAAAQAPSDPFPQPIPPSPVQALIEDFAIIPDSSPGLPARMSVLTRDPSGRLFVNDQRGPMYAIDDTGATVTEYLDLRDYAALAIISGSEQGFQSFAFHPEFATAGTPGFGRFYTFHSSSNTTPPTQFDPNDPQVSHHEVLLEWQTADPAAATFTPANAAQPFRELLRFREPFANHNGGLIAFDPNAAPADADFGSLYVSLGDGGSGGDPGENAQDLSDNAFGKILRIDPLGSDGVNGQYGIVPENVFAGDGDGSTLAEIYAYGFRHPQRFGWDSATGNLFLADIGQGRIEELDLVVNGGNYGWDQREGSFPFEGGDSPEFIDPVAEYDFVNLANDLDGFTGARAVTMGEVARGTGIPGLDGQLIAGDLPTGLIFTLDVDNDALDGGQDGLRELQPLDDSLQPVRLLELINEVRAGRGLAAVSRADLRLGFDTPGEVFILNKQDGVLRRLAVIPEPSALGMLLTAAACLFACSGAKRHASEVESTVR